MREALRRPESTLRLAAVVPGLRDEQADSDPGHDDRDDTDEDVATTHDRPSSSFPASSSSTYGRDQLSPDSFPETVRHDCQVTRRITSVIARPIIGSAIGAPSATTMALATTPSETNPSTRAWLPSAI